MYNKKLAEILNTFADIIEIQGGKNSHFKVKAYRQASLTLQNLPKDIAQYVNLEEEKFTEHLPGFGDAIQHKTIELIKTGEVHEFNELKQTIPPGLLEMLNLKNVGPKKVKKFYDELNITNLDELKEAINNGRVAELDGMGKKSAEKILDSIKYLKEYSTRTPLGLIYPTLKELLQSLEACPYVIQVNYAGSARRMEETIGDIDILTTGKPEHHTKIIKYFVNLPYIEKIEAEGDTKATVFIQNQVQVDLRVVNEDEYGAAMQYFTGNKRHNVLLRSLARKKGLTINEYGIFEIDTEKKVGGQKEEEIYQALNLQYIQPELRQGNNEIDEASQNNLPKLVQLKDIKGDLHTHSTYSDGNHSIAQMAEAAQKLGYEYIAITDHSESLKVSGGLNKKELQKKKAEIDKIQSQFEISILYGTEVDIMSDGSLDYDDETLAEFDIVVASVHSKLESDITERVVKAMKNPHVHIIGHLTTRLISKREGSPHDIKQIFQAAKDTGTVLEINSQPLRLDINGALARMAKDEFGLKFVINTDAHNTAGLQLMELGVGQARRGWLTKDDILNTLPLKKLISSLK
jgi:DNA polymerase (family 10)